MNRSAPPLQYLTVLAAAVLGTHLLLLQSPPRITPGEPARMPALQVRSVAPQVELPMPQPPRILQEKQAAARIPPSSNAIESVAIASPAPASEPSVEAMHATPRETTDAVHTAQAAPAPATALRIPGAVRLHFALGSQGRAGGPNGKAELAWRHDGSSYEATLRTALAGRPERVQHSTGRITEAGIAPLRYGDRSRGEQAAHFDRAAGRIVFSNNQPEATLAAGAQDRLSVLLQLGALLAGAPQRYPAGTTITLQTVGIGAAEPWLFTVEGDEELALPGGTLRAVRLSRPPQHAYDQRLELWLAPGMDYAPVRLRLTGPHGDWLDHQWSATDR